MKHMLQIEVRGLTLSEAQTARDYLQEQSAFHPTWGDKSFSGALDEDGEIVLCADVRFDSLAGMGDIRDKAKAWLDARMPGLTGYVHYHACSHDEDPPTPCVDIVKEWG